MRSAFGIDTTPRLEVKRLLHGSPSANAFVMYFDKYAAIFDGARWLFRFRACTSMFPPYSFVTARQTARMTFQLLSVTPGCISSADGKRCTARCACHAPRP